MATYSLRQSEKGIEALPAQEMQCKAFRTISSPLAATILEELAKGPKYPMEIARKLKVHEQKVYYHIRRMMKSGFLAVVKRESKAGATALYYAPQAPSFILRCRPYAPATKLTLSSPNEFLAQFIAGGELDATIVVGSPDPHGLEKARSRDGYYGMDFALFLGTFLSHVAHYHVMLDTEVREDDLRNKNLILIGGPIVNKITEKVNEKLPIYFDKRQKWAIYSKISGESYHSDEAGLVVKAKSPFNKEKYVLVIAGKRNIGTRAAILSFLRYSNLLNMGNDHNPKIFAKVIEGLDKDGDGVVDAIEVKE